MVDNNPAVDEAGVAVLAQAGDLNLGDGRAQAIAPGLASWLADANELNRKMAQARHLDLMPITVFFHKPE